MNQEPQICGRRYNPVHNGELPDVWNVEPNGDRTCSYCGSLHPTDYIRICTAYAAREPGYHFAVSDKPYKRYANGPGVENATQGGIKFYSAHVPDDGTDREELLFADAAARKTYTQNSMERFFKQ